jgi:hypothetical protein
MINSHWEDHYFTIPAGPDYEWYRVVDTSVTGPEDILDPGNELKLETTGYIVRSRSVLVLINKFDFKVE